MIRFLIIISLCFLTNSTYDKNVAINNVNYQKAKSECMWKGHKKNSDNLKECVKLKMSK